MFCSFFLDSFCFGHFFGETFLVGLFVCLGIFLSVCLEFFVWFLSFGLNVFFCNNSGSSIVIHTPEIHNLHRIPSSLRI